MVNYFLDTCIWRDFYERRIGSGGRNLGSAAAKLFLKILKKKDKILFSEALLWELNKDYSASEINDMLNLLYTANSLIKIEIGKEEFILAKTMSLKRNIPFIDALNALQAKNHNAIMVSQDMHYLKDLKDIVTTKRPEELI